MASPLSFPQPPAHPLGHHTHTTPHLHLRPIHPTDTPAIHILRRNPTLWLYTPTLPETSPSQTLTWLETRVFADPSRVLNFVIELLPSEAIPSCLDPAEKEDMHGQQGLVIGIVGAVGGPEVGYVIHPAFWGRGYATEALRGFLEVFWRGVPSASVSASETPTSGPTSAASAPAAPRARAEAEGRTHDIKAELAAPPSERRDAAPRLTDGVDYLQAITDPENVGSVRVLEKVGFVLWASLSDNFLSPHEGIGVRCTVVYRVARPGTSLGKGEGPFELGGEREGKQ